MYILSGSCFCPLARNLLLQLLEEVASVVSDSCNLSAWTMQLEIQLQLNFIYFNEGAEEAHKASWSLSFSFVLSYPVTLFKDAACVPEPWREMVSWNRRSQSLHFPSLFCLINMIERSLKYVTTFTLFSEKKYEAVRPTKTVIKALT